MSPATNPTNPDNTREVSVSRVIAAPAAEIFDVLADPTKHQVIDGSDTVQGAKGNPERLHMGAKFGMKMRIGFPYTIKNTIVEFDEGRRIAWRHFGKHVWRYTLEPVDGGTKVTETFDWSTAISPKFIERMHYPEKHPENMTRTLERLDAYVTTGRQ